MFPASWLPLLCGLSQVTRETVLQINLQSPQMQLPSYTVRVDKYFECPSLSLDVYKARPFHFYHFLSASWWILWKGMLEYFKNLHWIIFLFYTNWQDEIFCFFKEDWCIESKLQFKLTTVFNTCNFLFKNFLHIFYVYECLSVFIFVYLVLMWVLGIEPGAKWESAFAEPSL